MKKDRISKYVLMVDGQPTSVSVGRLWSQKKLNEWAMDHCRSFSVGGVNYEACLKSGTAIRMPQVIRIVYNGSFETAREWIAPRFMVL